MSLYIVCGAKASSDDQFVPLAMYFEPLRGLWQGMSIYRRPKVRTVDDWSFFQERSSENWTALSLILKQQFLARTSLCSTPWVQFYSHLAGTRRETIRSAVESMRSRRRITKIPWMKGRILRRPSEIGEQGEKQVENPKGPISNRCNLTTTNLCCLGFDHPCSLGYPPVTADFFRNTARSLRTLPARISHWLSDLRFYFLLKGNLNRDDR